MQNKLSLFSKLRPWGSGFLNLDIALVLGILVFTFIPSKATYAGNIEPVKTKCWYLVSDRLEIENTCIYEATWWMGGGFMSLLWEDGLQTTISWGLHGRGQQVCQRRQDLNVDGVCGSEYSRDPVSLDYLSEDTTGNAARCVRLNQNSVCWLHPF